MKKCKYCQTEINKKAKICPQCHKNQANPFFITLRIILGIIIVLIGIGGIVGAGSDSKENDEDECYITLEEFNKIENGMTYDQVKNIVGCEGTVNSDTEVENFKMTVYSWYGKDRISNAIVDIENNKLVNKTQIGLQ